MTRGYILQGGFTLLEVMVAVSILGLSLTIILSSQVGLVSSAERTHNLTYATNLARCKMAEIEVEVIRKGFQLTDVTADGPCCEDEVDRAFSCSWKIETVELPEMTEVMTVEGEGDSGASDTGVIGKLMEMKNSAESGESPLAGGDMSQLGSFLGEGSEASSQSLATSLMSMVYPNLKPMLEASIRRATLTISWPEGTHERRLVLVQFLTNPQQGLDPLAEEQLRALGDMADQESGSTGSLTTGTGTQGKSARSGLNRSEQR